MKQHITPEQLNELSEQGEESLKKWWRGGNTVGSKFWHSAWLAIGWVSNKAYGQDGYLNLDDGYLPLLSIGQMIEFLQTTDKRIGIDIHKATYFDSDKEEMIYSVDVEVCENPLMESKGDVRITKVELCDALWDAVKEVLEK